jgi:ABC-2 type transport system ATP-binding protein
MPSAAADTILRVENLTKRFGGLTAVAGASFTVREGEVLGLIGPNGSGKTTLFECLGGVLPIDEGQIEAQRAGAIPALFYLPDGIAPWPDQPVAWALDFAIGFFGGRAELRDEVTARLALGPFLRQPIGTLSKGQRKRALLALGLLMPHSVLLADEPFDGLDLRQMRDTAALLRDLARSGRTLFLSIHQIVEAARVCDRFVLLSGGHVRGEGTLGELASRASMDDADLEAVVLALT